MFSDVKTRSKYHAMPMHGRHIGMHMEGKEVGMPSNSFFLEYGTCTSETLNRLFKVDNREQKEFLLAHWRSHRKVPYPADWSKKRLENLYCIHSLNHA